VDQKGINVNGGKVEIENATFNFGEKQDALPVKQKLDNLEAGVSAFFGRDRDRVRIDDLFAQQRDGLPIVLITGMAGVGKSELALQYAKSKRDEHRGGVAYLNAATFLDGLQDFVMNPYTNIAGTADLRLHNSQPKMKARIAWDLWATFCEEENGSALIVIDNVTDFQGQIADFLPNPGAQAEPLPFRFVLTSRERWGDLPYFELEELELGEAIAMFEDVAGESYREHLTEHRALLPSLCARLGRLPLALALAGCWLKNSQKKDEKTKKTEGKKLTDLIEALEKQGLASWPLNPMETENLKISQSGLVAAFRVSWEFLQEMEPSAQQTARVLTMFALLDLPWDLVEQVAAVYPVRLPEPEPEPEPRRSWWQKLWDWLRGLFGKRSASRSEPLPPKVMQTPIAPIRDLERSRVALCRASLLREVSAGVYRLHPLLHEFFGLQWGADHDRDGWKLAWITGVDDRAAAVPAALDWEMLSDYQNLRLQFAEASAAALRWSMDLRQSQSEPMVRRHLNALHSSLNAGLARLEQEPAFARTFQQAGATHQQMKAALARGDREAANRFYEQTLQGYERAIEQGRQVMSADSLRLAGFLNKVATFYREVGRYREGIPLAEEALAIVQEKGSKRSVASYANDLASLYYNQGKYEAAEPLCQKALALRRELLGEKHPDVASSLNGLAVLYRTQGKYEAAEPLQQQALALRRELLGEKHPHVALSLHNLAALYDSQGKYEAAEPLLQQALALLRELLGEKHPHVATSLNNLAWVYRNQGQYAKALPLFQQALVILLEALGENHPNTQDVMRSIQIVSEKITDPNP
jgi:tetratricopeptide (TPR) repeat protein